MKKHKALIAFIGLILICVCLTGCSGSNSYEENLKERMKQEETQRVQSSPIPQDTTKFYSETHDSVNGTFHIYRARSQQNLVDFLEWLDVDKYEIFQILTDGRYAYDFYVIYHNKGIESRP